MAGEPSTDWCDEWRQIQILFLNRFWIYIHDYCVAESKAASVLIVTSEVPALTKFVNFCPIDTVCVQPWIRFGAARPSKNNNGVSWWAKTSDMRLAHGTFPHRSIATSWVRKHLQRRLGKNLGVTHSNHSSFINQVSDDHCRRDLVSSIASIFLQWIWNRMWLMMSQVQVQS